MANHRVGACLRWLVFAGVWLGWSPPPPQVIEPGVSRDAQFSVTTEMVLLNVVVKDSQGRPVSNLQAGDFEVEEEGVPQRLVFFEAADAVPAVVLLIDTSSSMKGSLLQEAKRAGLEFLDQSRRGAAIALVAFDDQVRVLQNFTDDSSSVRAAIDRLESGGGTALYGALAESLSLVRTADSKRQIVVLLSDGQDQDSSKGFSEIKALVESTPAVIYSVGQFLGSDRKRFMTGKKYFKEPALDLNLNPVWVLTELSDLSGGIAFFPQENQELTPFFGQIARELRQHYVLGYEPRPHPGEPRFRSVKVRAGGSAQTRRLTVRTRRGYVG